MAAATASTSHQSLNPTVEDYDSDVDSVKVSNFNRPPSASQANVTAKRSHPSDLGVDKSPPTEKVVFSDRQSDSGYSSHTAATVSSADSALSANSQSPPVAPVHLEDPEPLLPTPPSPAQRRPTLGDDRRRSNQTSPVKPLQRAPSVSSRNRPARERRPTESRSVDCTDPTCKKCVSSTGPTTSTSTTRGRRPVPPHLDSAVDVSYPPSTRSDPVAPSYTSPNSPTYTRQASYMHGSTVVQPATTTTRRRSSSNARARPQSYHGDPRQPGYSYNMSNVPAPYPSPPQEISQPHGPPPAMSAHFVMQHPGQQHPAMQQQYGGQVHPMYQPPMPGMPHGYYPPHQMQQTSPPYEPQRPHMPTRNSSASFNARGSMYGQPRVTQEQKALPSARYAPQPQVQQALVRQEPLPQKQLKYTGESESEYSSSEGEQEEEEEEVDERRQRRNSRALMPPPKLTPAPVQQNRPSPQRRPSLHRRPNTTPQIYPSERRASVSQPHILSERPREQRESRPSRANSSAQARAQSKARPSMPLKTQSAYDTRDARVIVENGKPRRRKIQAYDVDYNVEDKRRSRVYDFEDKPRQKVIEVEDRRRPRNYEAIERRRSHVAAVEGKRQSKIYVESLSDDSESDDYDDVPPQRRRVQEVYQDERPQRRRKEDMYADDVAPQRRRKDDFYEEEEVMPLQRRRKEEVYDEDAIVPAPRRRKEFYEEEPAPQPPQQPLRRRKTVTEHDSRPSRQAKMQDAVNDIEAYQRQTRGNDVPFNDLTHRAAKRTSRVVRPGDDDDEDGSSHSGGKTRISQSNRTTVTNGNNGDIRLRIDASNPISLHLPGDMEGRTLQINPAEDGMADIVIANQRDTESTYRSERGSMYGTRRAITSSDQARREAEVQSMRSVRTSNSRREERKPLRRSRRDIEIDER
ncbi:hypothetical protein BU24DRAFT_408813 [Aaosphaeria arxii CBS 175.79]|uniref:Uncharacterized protein n=1 Tax=Aaosphaeria arxii CBS 175.79 TaxID=1450172 RepID=A0A6A5XTP1_9PLEO|nr:uncharacterized protein BU24DRAFT_408813 [Aaosphaeria arxii CBS 175.79]KAF2015614.1 hypothetical protein BU24DRAFT_408813 [Aaosphaeria arxii CBS 175.79]